MNDTSTSDLLVDITGHVATVTLNRPPHNFLDFDQIGHLADTLEGLERSGEIRAVVLAANGRSFCAGANFAGGGVAPELQGGADREAIGGSATLRLYDEGVRLFEFGLPIVAAIQGPAIGGGLGLAMVADFRITCPEARFSANFAALGIHQGFGLSVTLPERLGPSGASLVLLTSRRFTGEQAVQVGLADELVDSSRLVERARELASEMAANAPLALRSIRATLRQGLADRVRRATRHEASEQARLSLTADAAEGIRAVAERRPGDFGGS